jgi:hypothetical protein
MGLPVITIVDPSDQSNFTVRTVAFDVTYQDDLDAFTALSLVLEADTVTTFDSGELKKITYVDVVSGSTVRYSMILEPGLWYWRVTAENSSGTTVSDTLSLTISQIIKRSLYQYANVGKAPVQWSSKRSLYQYLNIEKAPVPWSNRRSFYQYENIGKFGPLWNNQRGFYQYENITADPPFPYISKISATRGPAGSVLTIWGNGFGYSYESDIANPDRYLRGYGGAVYINDLMCSILSWSWTEIVFQLPSEAESGPIKVQLTDPTVRDSNIKGFEVYAGVPTDDIGIELFICARENPNTVLCQLDGAFNKAFQMVQNNAGSGSFSISRYDRFGGSREYIKDQNLVLVKLDGNPIFKWIIESRKPNYVDAAENQIIEVSGRGILSMLGWAVVYPENLADPVLDRTFTGTASMVLRKLILEAQARGGLQGISVGWEDDKDSLGNSFTESINLSFRVGTPLTEVIAKFTDGLGYFDIEMTPDLRLKIYKSKGEELQDQVIYRPGQAILSHQNQSDGTSLVNEVLIEGSEKSIAVATHTQSQISYGRREGYLSASNLQSGLSEYGQAYLSRAAYPIWGIQGTVTKFTDVQGRKIKPLESYLIGDWIGWNIPPEGSDTVGFEGILRVKGVTVSEDDDTGDLSYVLDLHNAMLEHEIKLTQKVERMSQYSGGSDVLSVAPSSSSGYSTNEVNALLASKANTVHDNAFTDMVDTPETLIPGRLLLVNEEGTQLVFAEREMAAVFLQGVFKAKVGTNFIAEFEPTNMEANGITVDPTNFKFVVESSGQYVISFSQIATRNGEASLKVSVK